MFKARILGLAVAFVGGIALFATQARAQVQGTGHDAKWTGHFHPVPTVGGKVDAGGKIQPTDGQAGMPMCFGDGTGMKCPAANVGMPGHGCENSEGMGGGLLEAIGNPKVSKDSMHLKVSGLPSHSTTLFLQGQILKQGVYFGDGILCLQGAGVSLAVKRAAYGISTYPEYGELPLCDAGKIPPFGGTVYYQVLYRDEHPFGGKEHFNLSNAWMTVWAP